MKRFLLFLFSTCVFAIASDPLYLRAPKLMLTPEFVEQTDWNPDHVHDSDYGFGYLTQEVYEALPDWERSWLVVLNEDLMRHHNFDARTLEVFPTFHRPDPSRENYHTYATPTSELTQLAHESPNLLQLNSAGKSVKGKDLWYVTIGSQSSNDSHKPKLLLISSMHGDEVVGKELLVYLIRYLLKNYDSDSRIRKIIDYGDLYLMPSMNPDGTESRKRWNANTSDLNRNFPELTESPFDNDREPEILALMKLQRDNSFVTAVNFHTGSVCFNMPWDSLHNIGGSKPFGDKKVMDLLAREYADLNPAMNAVNYGNFDHGITYGYEWFPIKGGMQDWADYFFQGNHATIELNEVKWPSADVLPEKWEENRESMLKFIENSLTGIHLKVVNADAQPVSCEVGVDSADRWMKYPEGYVHRTTTSDTQQVTIRAANYQTKTIQLNPQQFNGGYQTIVLDKR